MSTGVGTLALGDEVGAALASGRPVVALETTLVAHGFPHPHGVEVARASEDAVRDAGAVPATVGVLDGRVRVGLTPDEIVAFGQHAQEVRKLGPRDIAVCAVQGAMGATTVGATITICHAAGIRVMATGGTGGVHRGYPDPPDVSADVQALQRCSVVTVSAGVKSLLDVPATMEVLETLGVPVLGWRTETLPLFFAAKGGPPVQARVESAAEVARIATLHWGLGGGGLVLTRPPDRVLVDVEPLVARITEEARRRGITGQEVTPYVLARLHEESAGETLAVNRDLVVANARLAAELAVALAIPG